MRSLALAHLRTLAPLLLCFLLLLTAAPHAQEPASPETQRISERIRALQDEARRLAGQAKTLVGDLRGREIDRDVKIEQLKQAEAETAEAERALQATTQRLADLELWRINQLPDLRAELVDIYKRGRSRYARLLFDARDVRELARAARAVGALSALTERRLTEHRNTLNSLQQERTAFEQRARDLRSRETEARRAKRAAYEAIASVTGMMREIDSRRDLAAQYVGELQVAYTRVQEQLASLGGDRPATVAVPIRPFQGGLEWPVDGRVVGLFGQPSSRLGGPRNGIEISADEDAPVRAVHGGTVGFAGPFTGFGSLVIVDHGSNHYSLYGYLASTTLQQGDVVEAGAEVGRVALAPAGPPTVYFEMRIDGRSVNPVQWLKPR